MLQPHGGQAAGSGNHIHAPRDAEVLVQRLDVCGTCSGGPSPHHQCGPACSRLAVCCQAAAAGGRPGQQSSMRHALPAHNSNR